MVFRALECAISLESQVHVWVAQLYTPRCCWHLQKGILTEFRKASQGFSQNQCQGKTVLLEMHLQKMEMPYWLECYIHRHVHRQHTLTQQNDMTSWHGDVLWQLCTCDRIRVRVRDWREIKRRLHSWLLRVRAPFLQSLVLLCLTLFFHHFTNEHGKKNVFSNSVFIWLLFMMQSFCCLWIL